MFPDIKARHSDRKNPGQCSGSQGEINTAQIKDLFLLSGQSAENLLPTFRREGKTTYFRKPSAKYSVDFSRPWIRKIWGVGVIKKRLVEWESCRWSLLSREGSPPMKVTGPACRLAKGCKLQIVVSLRVFRMESQYFYPYMYRLGYRTMNEKLKIYAPINSKVKHPPGQPPGHLNFWRFPPLGAKKPFKCPTNSPFHSYLFSFAWQCIWTWMWGNFGQFCTFCPKLPHIHVQLHCHANEKR